MREIKYYIVIAVISILFGFYMGRGKVNRIETVKYVKGETIVKKVPIEIPYKVEIPANPIYIYRTDTLHNNTITIQVVDTLAILADWIEKRHYSQSIFDDANGKLLIDASVQYNQLQSLDYSFTPIIKHERVVVKPIWTPYLETAYNTFHYWSVGGGVFYHNLGIGTRYSSNFRDDGWELNLKYKF